ncbi:MAG: putative hydroxymethylpyrimidine transporter CytX [Deltaproteobacteria bacterium]|nr:putative hydroxymethylpyrimidine transporter CytX [Deltaproteobacteria bacterium]
MKDNKGIEPIGQESRNLTGVDFFLLWSGAAVSLAEIWAGGLLIPLGFLTGVIVILAGHLIGNTPLAFGGIIGSKIGIPTMVAVRPSFGIRGSYFATLLNLVQLIGWTGVMLWIGGKAAQGVWPLPVFGFRGWVVITGFATTLWALLGHRYWKWLHRIAITALIALCCLMSHVVLKEYGLSRLMGVPAKGGMPFMVGLDLVIAMPISWLPLVCDYSRFGKGTGPAFWGTWVGYFIVSSWMYTIGLAAALATQSATPESMVLELMVGLGLAAPAIIIVLFSTFTTTFLDIYSTAVSALNIWPEMGQRRGSLACGILGTVLALMFPATAYEGFLLFIGSVFCPLFGVVLADYFFLRRQRYFETGFDQQGRYWYVAGFNPWAFVAWGIGFGLYHLLQRETGWGSSIPSLIATGVMYLILMQCFGFSSHMGEVEKGGKP